MLKRLEESHRPVNTMDSVNLLIVGAILTGLKEGHGSMSGGWQVNRTGGEPKANMTR